MNSLKDRVISHAGFGDDMDLKVLRDDQHAFPPYQVCILARQDAMNEPQARGKRSSNCRGGSPTRK